MTDRQQRPKKVEQSIIEFVLLINECMYAALFLMRK